MDNCFASCSCDGYEGISKPDLDRFTDTIEKVLNDKKGRKLFRKFMYNSKMKVGIQSLDLLDNIDRLLNYKENPMSFSIFLRTLDSLIDKAELIEALDNAAIKRITDERESANKKHIVEGLKILKLEASKTLEREYLAFKRHLFTLK